MTIMDVKKPNLSEKILFTGIVILTVQLIKCYDQEWDHFRFVQAWPPGTCAYGNWEHHTCHVDERVNTWTIHGLWPTFEEKNRPIYCDDSWIFDETKVKSFEDQLDVYWPNVYNDTPHTSLWQREWSKHGTCCADLASTAGEFNYFTTALRLNKQYDLLQILANDGVTPSETARYYYTDFLNAVQNVIGFEPIVQCTTRKQQYGETYHLIDKIQICLNKDFSPRSCTDGSSYPSSLYFSKGSHSLAAFEKGEKRDFIGRRHSHHRHAHSDCPEDYKFHYPPIHPIR